MDSQLADRIVLYHHTGAAIENRCLPLWLKLGIDGKGRVSIHPPLSRHWLL